MINLSLEYKLGDVVSKHDDIDCYGQAVATYSGNKVAPVTTEDAKFSPSLLSLSSLGNL